MLRSAIIRNSRGDAYDLSRPGCLYRADVTTTFEVKTDGPDGEPADRVRVKVDGVEADPVTREWPTGDDDKPVIPAAKASAVKVTVEHLDDKGKVLDTLNADVALYVEPQAYVAPMRRTKVNTAPAAAK